MSDGTLPKEFIADLAQTIADEMRWADWPVGDWEACNRKAQSAIAWCLSEGRWTVVDGGV